MGVRIEPLETGDGASAGEGSSFCAGADVDDVTSPGFRAALHTMLHTVTMAPIPIVAAVNGLDQPGNEGAVGVDDSAVEPQSPGRASTGEGELATLAPLTLHYIKQAVDAAGRGARLDEDRSIIDAFEACWSSADLREGLQVRSEKQQPRFERR